MWARADLDYLIENNNLAEVNAWPNIDGFREHLIGAALIGIAVPPETPSRIARWLSTLQGQPNHNVEVPTRVLGKPFRDPHTELVMVKDISFTAVCEHHLLPFHGHAAVGYVPHGQQLAGLSKLARLVKYYCEFPTLQEHITTHVADALHEFLGALGTMVVLYNVVHTCMTARGVQDPDANTTTSAVRGVFREDAQARAEFLALLNHA